MCLIGAGFAGCCVPRGERGCSAAESRPVFKREPEAQPGGLTAGKHIRLCSCCLQLLPAGEEGSQFTFKLQGLKHGFISTLFITCLKQHVKDMSAAPPVTGCLHSVVLTVDLKRGGNSFEFFSEDGGTPRQSSVSVKSRKLLN